MSNQDDKVSRGARLWLRGVVALIAMAAVGLLVLPLYVTLRTWDLGLRDTTPAVRSVGPTMVQLERLKYLVSTRVHVADVLVGESRWLEGSWITQGDALLAVDMKKAEIRNRDEKGRTAVIVLPQPAVLSPRVNHERTRQWDIKSSSWIPLASLVLGDRAAMEKRAMLEAQQLVERAAGSEDNRAMARKAVEGMLAELYQGVGWEISVQWKYPSHCNLSLRRQILKRIRQSRVQFCRRRQLDLGCRLRSFARRKECETNLARDTDVQLHGHRAHSPSIKRMLKVIMTEIADHSTVSVSLSCLSDFRVSLSRRDCLRCRRRPVIRRARFDLASVRVACRASASLINVARLDPGLSLAMWPLSLGWMLGSWPLRWTRSLIVLLGDSGCVGSCLTTVVTADDSIRMALSLGSIAAPPLSGCQA